MVETRRADDSGTSLSRNAHRVLEARYLRRDGAGRIAESPAELCERVARGVAHAELLLHGPSEARRWEPRFRELLLSRDFLPNSPTLMNAGTELGQLSACFVLPVPDSLEGIFEALKTTALVQQSGGGVGLSFSRLRPRGDRIASTGGTTPGPLAFIRTFDAAAENIRLGGKRRGALMGVLRVDHPDVMEFIEAKAEEGSLRNFNLSVGVTDAFMEAAGGRQSYSLVNPRTGGGVAERKASDVFDGITYAAWMTGDPGVLFLDAIERANPTPGLGRIEATNPCGEVPLLPYESCNLGSIHLGHMVVGAGEEARLDTDRLRDTARVAVRFLDDVIEVNRYPTPDIAEASLRTRKLGLGVMGFAEALIRLGVPYDTDRAVELADRIMSTIEEAALETSVRLAELRGVYPAWRGSRHERAGVRVRNATRTSIAPTGTISILAETSASIEPLFALAYRRHRVLEEAAGENELGELNPLLVRELGRRGLDRDRILRHVLQTGLLEGCPGVPEDLHRLFITALEVPPERHLAIQAAFQRHTDNSVAKTINLPHSIPPDEVARIYARAWELGVKGITVFRHGSRSEQVVQLGLGEEPHEYEHGHTCDPAECRL